MVNKIFLGVLASFLILGNYNLIDIKEAIVYYGNSISPTYPSIGILLFISILSFMAFSKEIISFFKSVKSKIRVKKTFK